MVGITDKIALDDHEIHERFVRASGARAQNMRREATAVELRLDIGGSSLPADVKRRLRALAKRAVTTDDVLLIVSRASRLQSENRRTAHVRLLALLRRAATRRANRQQTEPCRMTREERLVSKRRRGALKALRYMPREV
jgi:ribosome-associated protein